MHSRFHRLSALVVALGAVSAAPFALAGVTAEEAKALGTTLTAVGAEKAANKDGTIPAYTGGLTTPPAGFKAGEPVEFAVHGELLRRWS